LRGPPKNCSAIENAAGAVAGRVCFTSSAIVSGRIATALLLYDSSMIFSENRFPLFRIMH
jgi:hypothetical protein